MPKLKKKFKPAAPKLSESTLAYSGKPKTPANGLSLTKITTLRAAIAISILGVAVFFSGLSNQFLGDDYGQIVNNIPVHSLSNVAAFFNSSTFYTGSAIQFSGSYFRPLMMTTFSFLYTLFGASSIAFHALQLSVYIACAFILFIVLRYFFRPAVALVLSLLFLVHPINSQAVYSIAAMQEPLFFFFGMLAFWMLVRFQDKTSKYVILTSICLFLSLLSKETGILFVFIALLYAFMTSKKQFRPLLLWSSLAVVAYLILKIHATGLLGNPHNAPIDGLNLWERLLNVPAIIQFYFTKFLFPIGLAHSYYWAYSTISVRHFLLPLVVDLAVVGLLIYAGYLLHKHSRMRELILYRFFTLWLLIGLLPCLQVIPLDLTACETWFIFPIVGLLGAIGTIYEAFPVRIFRNWITVIVILLLVLLGFRSAVRGPDWRNITTLSYHDILVSKEDYNSENIIAYDLATQGNLTDAKLTVDNSIKMYPNFSNYENLGYIQVALHDYPAAKQAFLDGLKYQDSSNLYVDLAQLTVVYGDPTSNKQFILNAMKKFPQNANLFFYLAIQDDKNGDNADAKTAISTANSLGQIDQFVYQKIMTNQPFTLSLSMLQGSDPTTSN